MNEELERLLAGWKWDEEHVEFMRTHPDLVRLKYRRLELYEQTKRMTPEERRNYFREAVPVDYR